jgi:nitrate/TMAO reductase-like tetraheme cytochrome c subunit
VVFGVLTLTVAAPTYIGVDKCKICHKVEHESWLKLPHAKAFERLKPEEQSTPECLKCHATGASKALPGVQCEACHGPGSDYKSIQVMKDRAKSIAAGLVVPDRATCEGCHTQAPHDLPAFDFEAAKPKGIHEFKPKLK